MLNEILSETSFYTKTRKCSFPCFLNIRKIT